MSETTKTQIQGYEYTSDNDEALKTKSGGRFGVCEYCSIAKCHNPNTAKEGQVRESCEITVKSW
jgi:tryptophanyl-tRNA synthetase